MDNRVQLKRNINKNYIYTLLQNTDFTRGIWMIYLAQKGMSLTQLGFLETIFHITSFTMEVPTGAIADIFGRRASRILGRIASLISVIILLMANSFVWFAISFVFTALSYNLESGAGDALIYDSLKEIGEEYEYMKVSGRKEVFYQTAGAISFLVGGYLASKNYDIAFILTLIIGTVAIVVSLTFKEPSIGRMEAGHPEEKIFIKVLKESIGVVKCNPKIIMFALITQIIMALCTCVFYYFQNYLKADGYNETLIGVIYALSALIPALIAPNIHRIEKRIKEKGMLILMPTMTVFCLWGVAFLKFHYIFFILLMISEGIIYISVSDYINKMIPSETRATVLSFESMVFSFFMIILFPVIGIVGDLYSLKIAFILLGILSTALVIVNSVLLIRKTI
ncbi:major facilitator superfamily protein [Oxobacter pfennigii]|uniref:Major facilitator superfamily protein n=1 Tax=Oxobacter pfennigii TaxID=36849 RepID=A0A0P8YE91_9CLOT|nr:MFS transporter [Oxobacter pfennigii]KPU45519.1 major facilitator superfamily protein [Oxobacter pfennigii]